MLVTMFHANHYSADLCDLKSSSVQDWFQDETSHTCVAVCMRIHMVCDTGKHGGTVQCVSQSCGGVVCRKV